MSTFLSLMEVFCIASSKGNLLINEQIKANQVLVIGPNGEQVGVKSLSDALTLSSYAGLDLVLISPNANPPVCKVMDYNKYKYEKSKKEKEALKGQKANMSELKEFRLSFSMKTFLLLFIFFNLSSYVIIYMSMEVQNEF